jgi:hypothetical protein
VVPRYVWLVPYLSAHPSCQAPAEASSALSLSLLVVAAKAMELISLRDAMLHCRHRTGQHSELDVTSEHQALGRSLFLTNTAGM